MDNPTDNTKLYDAVIKAYDYATETFYDTIDTINPFNNVISELYDAISRDLNTINQISSTGRLMSFSLQLNIFTDMCIRASRFPADIDIETHNIFRLDEVDDEGTMVMWFEKDGEEFEVELITNKIKSHLN